MYSTTSFTTNYTHNDFIWAMLMAWWLSFKFLYLKKKTLLIITQLGTVGRESDSHSVNIGYEPHQSIGLFQWAIHWNPIAMLVGFGNCFEHHLHKLNYLFLNQTEINKWKRTKLLSGIPFVNARYNKIDFVFIVYQHTSVYWIIVDSYV